MTENPRPAITQPTLVSLEIPPDIDALKWALFPRIHTQWFRKVAPQLGFTTDDIRKYIMGQVLTSITGDDTSAYLHFYGNVARDHSSIALGKRGAEERLTWELETEETPDLVKMKLQKAQAIIADSDWHDPQNDERIKNAHETLVREVSDIVAANSELRDAMDYVVSLKVQMSPYWLPFLDLNNLRG